jgi:radical SAM protein with 4Fe4S-binding SPASM domain
MSAANNIQYYATMACNVLFKPYYVIGLPNHIQVEVTTFCNMNCLSCGRRDIIGKPHHMQFVELKKIFDSIQPHNINLSGLGEPLLNPDIFKMINYCKLKGAVVNFPTNLNVSSSFIVKLVEAGPQQIKVSIDSATPETYRRVRRANSFEKIKKNIRLINALKQKHNLNHPEIRFNFALQKANIDELPQVLSLASELGVDIVYIQDLNYFSVEDKKNALCSIDQNVLRTMLCKCARIARKNRIKTNLNNWKRNFDLFYNKMLPQEQFQPNAIYCLFPWVSAFIDVHGNVKPCPVFVWEKDSYSLGNGLKNSFKLIWNGKKYRILRQLFKRRDREFAICKRCVPPSLFDMKHIFSEMILRS